jgi:N6-adenosine-specific RNA methylase IME4
MHLVAHPLATLFPLIEGAEFDELVADIKANGIHDLIDVYQGKILDGRNRYNAAATAGIEIEQRHIRHFRTELYGDPLAYVLSKNLKRRHLNDSQRGMVAANLATMRQGERTDIEPSANLQKVAQSEAAAKLHVSTRTVADSVKVKNEAVPELRQAVERGRLAVSAAAKAVTLTAEKQRQIATEAEAGHVNAARAVIKQEARDDRERKLGESQVSLPDKKFGVVLADPEWRFEPWSRKTGMDRAADNHYPTSCTEVIASRDVASIAADDCVLFLWATAPMLPHALVVMEAWGFDYKSNFVWAKDRIGMGYWNRNKHEHLLVGTRGKIPAPAMGTQADSLIEAPVGKHSAKPDAFLDMIDWYFPTLPKIELNRRGPLRPGWAAWGNEARIADESGTTQEPPNVPEIILPGMAPTFEYIGAFVDLTPPGKAVAS